MQKVSEVFNLTEDDFYTITYNKDHELIHGTTENYFEDDNEARDDCIIGLEVVSFEDGEVVEFDQTNTLDIKVIESLRAVGIMATELSFFIQYVSTDNC